MNNYFLYYVVVSLQLNVDLSQTDTAVIFGHGNVAIDVARILLTPVDILRVRSAVSFSFSSLKNKADI